MKKIFILLIVMFALAQARAQLVYKLKADSVLITNDSCTAELNLENSTKNIKGFLYNKGNGRTEFRKVTKLNDSTFIMGGDTLVIGGNAKNLATAPLTANGNYTHNWNNKQLFIDSLAQLRMLGTGIGVFGTRKQNLNFKWFGGWYGGPFGRFEVMQTLRNAADTYDSLGMGMLSANSVIQFGALNLGPDNTPNVTSAGVTAGFSGVSVWSMYAGYKISRVTVEPSKVRLEGMDSIMVHGVPSAFTVDAILALGPTLGTTSTDLGFQKVLKISPSAIVGNFGWALTGNTGTNPTSNFIGTTDSQALVIRTKNIEKMRIAADGKVGIGTSNPEMLLNVKNTASCCTAVLLEANYEALAIRSNIANGFPGTRVYNQNGNTYGAFSGRNSDKQIFIVADSGDIAFWTGYPTSQRMTIKANGNISIGSINPVAKLNVAGTGVFTDTLTATTMGNTDSSNRIATTAWVKQQKQTFSQTTTGTVTGTGSETTLISTGAGNLTIPASAWTVGKSYKVTVYGVYSTDSDNPANITLRLKLGSVTIASSGAIFLGSGKSNVPFTVQATFVCRSTGSSGTVFTFGDVTRDGNVDPINNGTSTSTINTTTGQTLDVTVQLSDTSSGNTISAIIVTLEAIN